MTKTSIRAGAPAPEETQPLSALAYALIALTGLAIGIGLLLFYIWKVPSLVAAGVDDKVFYVLLIPLGLSSAAFLFGVMHGVAALTHHQLGTTLKLGGPPVVFVLVMIGGFKLVPPPPELFDLTIRAISRSSQQPNGYKGEFVVHIGGDTRNALVDPNGESHINGVLAKFRNATLTVLPKIEGYESTLQSEKIVDGVVEVPLTTMVAKTRFKGSLTPLTSTSRTAKITVDGQMISSPVDEFGRFDFEVGGKDGDQVRVRVFEGNKLVYDSDQVLPGPVTLVVNERGVP